MDRGENGGVAGNDFRFIEKHPDKTTDARGTDNHEIASIPLVTSSSVSLTTSGEVIIIMHQCVCHGKNKTIHSSPQIEHCKNEADDRSIEVGDGQHATTLDNDEVPMSIRKALPHMPLRTCTHREW